MAKVKKVILSRDDVDAILRAFEQGAGDDYTTIRAVLELCPKRIKVEFALSCCNSIRHLMKDKRSIVALDAVQEYLDTSKPISKKVAAAAAASAADAAASAYAAAAAYATYYACAYAADAYAAAAYAADAYAAAYGGPVWKQVRAEKMREHLIHLKDLILQCVPAEYDNFLLRVTL